MTLGHLTGSCGPHPMNRCVPRKPKPKRVCAWMRDNPDGYCGCEGCNPLNVHPAPAMPDGPLYHPEASNYWRFEGSPRAGEIHVECLSGETYVLPDRTNQP